MAKTVTSWWRLLKPTEFAWWVRETREKNKAHNAMVETRQVIRAKIFRDELADVDKEFAGVDKNGNAYYNVPRGNRRRIARAKSHREWRELLAERLEEKIKEAAGATA